MLSSAHARYSLLGRFVPGLVLALAMSLLATAPAAQAAAVEPGNPSASGSPIPTLSWDVVPTADRYRVQGSEDASFSNFLFSEETTSNRYSPTRPFRAGTLYWRVLAIDSTGTSAWTTSQTTIAPPQVPTGVNVSSPTATVLPPVSPPIISWKPVAGATNYEIEMDAEGDGVGGTIRSSIRTTSFVWPDPQGVGERAGTEDYFVRVRARFDADLQSDWSGWVSYDVAQLPPVTSTTCATGLVCAPDPVGGVRGSRTVQDVILDWDPVKGAKQYEVWVALDRDFNNQVEKRIVSSTRYSPTTTYDNNNYFWKVRAYNAADQPTPWPLSPNEFQRRWPFSPTLVYPPVSAAAPVGDDFYYQWTPVRHATRYVLEVGNTPSFQAGSYATCNTASTTYTAGYAGDACMPSQGALYYWRVRAFDDPRGVAGIYSSTGQFVYNKGQVQQLSPASGATVTSPTLTWAPMDGIERYIVNISNSAGVVQSIETQALSWTPAEALPSDSDELDPDRNPDAFTWTVIGKSSNGMLTPTYSGRPFLLREAPIAAGASPLTPLPVVAGSVPWRFPSLSWQPYPSTAAAPVYYVLKVSETPGFSLPSNATGVLSARLSYPAVTDWGNYFLSPRLRTWWVEVYDATTNTKLSTGPQSTFTIESPPEVTGQQIALDGKAVDDGHTCDKQLVVGQEQTVCQGTSATPVLDWDPVVGIGSYKIFIAEDPDFTNLLMDPSGLTTQNTRWTPGYQHPIRAIDDNESGPAYFWFVQPCVAVNNGCGPDPRGTLDSGSNAFRKVSPKVVLTSPAANAQFADEISFEWQDYYLTNQATTAPFGGGAPPHQTATLYRIQVAQSATITDSNVIDDRTVDQATYTSFENTYPEGDLWWRVQAIDAQGNRLAWSDTRKIVKATPAPNLDPTVSAAIERPTVDPTARPTFGSHVGAGPVTFQWTAETFDNSWDIELYKNDDTTLSAANRVFAETVRQAAFSYTEPLTPSSEAYRWRVRRTDVRGKPGRWSDFGRFWVDPLPVTLGAPADGAIVDPNGTLFTWQPYAADATAQATRYVFDIDPLNNVGNNPGAVTTTATSWSPAQGLPTGTYLWSVVALDARGNRIGSSPTRIFEVDGAVRAVTPAQILAPEGSAVTKTLISVDPVWSRPDVITSYQWMRNDQGINGATSSTYTLTFEDYTKEVSLRVTGRKPGFTEGSSLSNAFAITAGGAVINLGAPVISGKATVGETLSTTSGLWSQPSEYRYQWLRQGAPIPNATGSSYGVTAQDAGKQLTVAVFAKSNGFIEGAVTTAPVAVSRLGSTTTFALSAERVSRKKRVKIGITVAVPSLEGPTGQVKVFDGAKALKTLTLVSARKGNLSWKLPKLKKGKHKIKVVYIGTPTVFGSKSKITKLFVSK